MTNELFLVKSKKVIATKNKEKIFLGDWCIDNHFKQDKPAICKYFLDKEKIDFNYLDQQNELIFQSIYSDLNSFHKTNFSKDFWKLLVGPFVQIFLHTFYDRYNVIKNCFENYNIDKICINSRVKNNYKFVNFSEFNSKMSHDDSFNEYFFYLIITNMNDQTYKNKIFFFDFNEEKKNKFFNKFINFKNRSFLKNVNIILSKVKKKYKKFINYFKKFFFIQLLKINKKNNYENVLFNHYFDDKYFNKLRKKINVLDITIFFDYQITNIGKGSHSRGEIFSNKNLIENEFYKLFFIALNKLFPTFYLEDFKKNLSYLEDNNLLFFPKKIWTFGSQYSDDLFKLWLAISSHKSKLLVFQHGGGQGTNKNEFYYKYDLSICDKYISWGWTNKNKSIVKIGKMNQFYKKKILRNTPFNLLLQTYSPARYTTTFGPRPTSSQWLSYFNDQFQFYNNLDNNIKDKSIVRIKGAYDSWDQINMWRSKFDNININYGDGKIEDLLKKTKIAVSTYNATTFLENFNYNIPTIIFWDVNYWKLDDEAKNDFSELEKIGVFFKDPILAANKINNTWEDIDDWWNKSDVRKVINFFKNKYARIPTNPIEEMIKINNIYK